MASARAAAVKFLRQFAAVVAVVAVVVLLGLAWNRFAPSLPGEGPAGEAPAVRGSMVKALPHAVKPSSGRGPGAGGVGRINSAGAPGLDLGDLLQPENLAVLRYTAELEAAIIGAVVIVNASYRSMRRYRRAKTSMPPPGDTGVSRRRPQE
jgi:hypothetical protein